MPTYKQNKIHIYKWRENPDNYEKQLQSNRSTSIKYQRWKAIQSIFFNILIDV
jgi:hypothetical protein